MNPSDPRSRFGPLSALEHENLDTLADDKETTAIILRDLGNPRNAESFSTQARALDFAGLDAVFRRLAQRGLVEGEEEDTDAAGARPHSDGHRSGVDRNHRRLGTSETGCDSHVVANDGRG